MSWKKPPKKTQQKNAATIHTFLTENDPAAYEDAYRIGLAAALIQKAETTQQIEKTTRYTLNATPEEIWFWTSKLLDDEINTRALDALAILSGATELNNTTHPVKQAKPKIKAPKKGTFWPLVRQRMKEKALQLYMKDHPESETAPKTKELRKGGYLQTAKTLALRETHEERKIMTAKDQSR